MRQGAGVARRVRADRDHDDTAQGLVAHRQAAGIDVVTQPGGQPRGCRHGRDGYGRGVACRHESLQGRQHAVDARGQLQLADGVDAQGQHAEQQDRRQRDTRRPRRARRRRRAVPRGHQGRNRRNLLQREVHTRAQAFVVALARAHGGPQAETQAGVEQFEQGAVLARLFGQPRQQPQQLVAGSGLVVKALQQPGASRQHDMPPIRNERCLEIHFGVYPCR